jgi:hypothetical protein
MDKHYQDVTRFLTDALTSRRNISRRFVVGALIVLGCNRVADTIAASLRSEGSRRRGAAAQIAPLQGPVTCDAAGPSGIAGLVTIGPMCPVVTQNNPCPDQPFAATLVVRDALGHELCLTRSGEDGRFQVVLPPGWYQLVPVTGSAGLPYAAPQDVVVEPDRYTEVTVSYDSGIR